MKLRTLPKSQSDVLDLMRAGFGLTRERRRMRGRPMCVASPGLCLGPVVVVQTHTIQALVKRGAIAGRYYRSTTRNRDGFWVYRLTEKGAKL